MKLYTLVLQIRTVRLYTRGLIFLGPNTDTSDGTWIIKVPSNTRITIERLLLLGHTPALLRFVHPNHGCSTIFNKYIHLNTSLKNYTPKIRRLINHGTDSQRIWAPLSAATITTRLPLLDGSQEGGNIATQHLGAHDMGLGCTSAWGS